MDSIRVHSRRTVQRDGKLRVVFGVDGVDPHDLWFEVDERFADFVDDSFDAAAVALLIPAMAAGLPLALEGPMSAGLEWNLNHHVVPLVRSAFPYLRETEATAAERREGQPASAGGAVMTAMSNGVDSLNACMDHLAEDTPVDMRLTHFVFHSRSVYFRNDWRRGLYKARTERARATAAEIGLPLVEVFSNVDDFYHMEHQKSHTLKHAALPLVLQGGVKSWFYASSFPYSRIKSGPTHDIASLDPLVLPMLSTETTRLASTGCRYSRVEKTARIADYPIAWRRLDVCLLREQNCSKCPKCLRTLLTLEVLGKLNRFADVFDLETYRHVRPAYIPTVVLSSKPILAEIAHLMKTTGFRTTPSMWGRAAKQATLRKASRASHLSRRALELRRQTELKDAILKRLPWSRNRPTKGR